MGVKATVQTWLTSTFQLLGRITTENLGRESGAEKQTLTKISGMRAAAAAIPFLCVVRLQNESVIRI